LDYKIVSLDEIKVIGIETKTSNETAQTEIPKLWKIGKPKLSKSKMQLMTCKPNLMKYRKKLPKNLV